MSDSDFDNNPRPLVEEVAENMSIIAGATDDKRFMPQAERLLRLLR